jgi:hypothetical protein
MPALFLPRYIRDGDIETSVGLHVSAETFSSTLWDG